MLEIPEARTLGAQLRQSVVGRTVEAVLPPTKEHKFCFFSHEPKEIDKAVRGLSIVDARGFGMFGEMELENGTRLTVNDGVNLRLVDTSDAPKFYQMLMPLSGGKSLAFTIAMYGGINMRDGARGDMYYDKSRDSAPFDSPDFDAEFFRVRSEAKPSLSAKAFLATEQRFPGVGNGVIQDILFTSRINPRRKIASLSGEELTRLLAQMKKVLGEMTALGGRDIEKDLYGNPGGYKTLLSKNTLSRGCPVCGGAITKEAYLGGSVYYCSVCQPK